MSRLLDEEALCLLSGVVIHACGMKERQVFGEEVEDWVTHFLSRMALSYMFCGRLEEPSFTELIFLPASMTALFSDRDAMT